MIRAAKPTVRQAAASNMSAAAIETEVDHFMTIVAALTRLLEQENELLHQKKPQALLDLAEEKSRLAAAYGQAHAKLREMKSELAKLAAGLKSKLSAAMRSFQQALETNQRLLARLRAVTEGLVRAIGDEVAKKTSVGQGYGRPVSAQAARGQPAVLAVNVTA
ncbi:MAG: hypothetical protein AAGF15_03025 [Pseudomonadota bacterium]